MVGQDGEADPAGSSIAVLGQGASPGDLSDTRRWSLRGRARLWGSGYLLASLRLEPGQAGSSRRGVGSRTGCLLVMGLARSATPAQAVRSKFDSVSASGDGHVPACFADVVSTAIWVRPLCYGEGALPGERALRCL